MQNIGNEKSPFVRIITNPFVLAPVFILIFLTCFFVLARNRSEKSTTTEASNTNTSVGTNNQAAEALQAAEKKNNVSSLQSVAKAYPNSKESEKAKELIHDKYKSALENFEGELSVEKRKEYLPFFEKLVSYLESNEQNAIEVRYIKFNGNDENFQHEPMIDQMTEIVKAWEECLSAFDNETIMVVDGSSVDKGEINSLSKPTIVLNYFDDLNNTFFKAGDGTEVLGTDVRLRFSLVIPNDTSKLDIEVTGRTMATRYDSNDDPYIASENIAINNALEKLLKLFNKGTSK